MHQELEQTILQFPYKDGSYLYHQIDSTLCWSLTIQQKFYVSAETDERGAFEGSVLRTYPNLVLRSESGRTIKEMWISGATIGFNKLAAYRAWIAISNSTKIVSSLDRIAFYINLKEREFEIDKRFHPDLWKGIQLLSEFHHVFPYATHCTEETYRYNPGLFFS